MVAKTVLVVEDDPCVRIVAEEMFAAAGIEVESVQRADQALDIVAQRAATGFSTASKNFTPIIFSAAL